MGDPQLRTPWCYCGGGIEQKIGRINYLWGADEAGKVSNLQFLGAAKITRRVSGMKIRF